MPTEIRADRRIMPEVIRNPLTGRTLIIASQRRRRQGRMRPVSGYPSDLPLFDKSCPFCPGNEEMTPETLIAYPDNNQWLVRGFANLRPIQMIEDRGIIPTGSSFLDGLRKPAIGAHEIIVPFPVHNTGLSSLGEEYISAAFWAIVQRYFELKKDSRFQSFYAFMNYGERAGASVTHLHFQLEAHSVVPHILATRFEKMATYQDYTGGCLMEKILREERRRRIRGIVCQGDNFVAFVPYFPAELYHIIIAPKGHYSSFAYQLQDERVRIDFAFVLREALRRIKKVLQGKDFEQLSDPPFLFLLFTAPYREEESSFHWHAEILPAVTYKSGHERGLDEDVIPANPVKMAEKLRRAFASTS
jgi:UDPglucose--hexose-1-phosphate uridylyltransferase